MRDVFAKIPLFLGALLFGEMCCISMRAYASGLDNDNDLVCDSDEDRNGNGDLLDDDTDDDGIPDAQDEDDDGDGVSTRDEDFDGDGDPRNDDLDGFGNPDYLDPNTPLDVDRDDHIASEYGGDDCDDTRFGIKPSAEYDPLYDGEDWDCDGADDFDGDGDGYQSAQEIEGGEDCNDYDPETHPDANEDRGPIDRDCDGWTDRRGSLTSIGGCDCDMGKPEAAPASLLLAAGLVLLRRAKREAR